MFISLRDRLSGSVVDLLKDEQMACTDTHEGLVSLVGALSLYREEGRALFPEIFIVDDLDRILKTLPFSEYIQIGKGPKSPMTMALALKKCAPLAQGGWAVYILRQADEFTFGLFRCGMHLLSVPLVDLLITKGDVQLPALLVRQVAENTVELLGVRGGSLLISFGATRENHVSPVEAQAKLVSCIVRDVPNTLKEQATAFYASILSRVLKAAHGTLAVVTAKPSLFPRVFKDGIRLNNPLSVIDDIDELVRSNSCVANTRLQSAGALLSGMLLSDGITAFSPDGRVVAYNIFVKHPSSSSPPNGGGARRRTFQVLSSHVGHSLSCAFMQSQDGAVEYKVS